MIDGKKVFFYRIKKGLTQKAACEGICSVSYLSKIENNSITPSPEILQLLCERLDIEYSYVSEEAIIALRKEIHIWYKDIKYRNEQVARQKFADFENRMKDMDDPGLVNLYEVMAARYYIYIDDMDKAKGLLDRLAEVKKLSTSEIEFYTLQFRGLYEFLYDNYRLSLDYYKKAYVLSRTLRIDDEELYYQLANLTMRLGYFSQSLFYGITALEAFNAEANYSRSIDCHIILGINYSRLKDFESARSHYSIALNASKFNPALNAMLPGILHNLGHSHFQAEQYDEALSVLRECLEKRKGSNTASTIALIAHTYFNLQKIKEAKQWLKKGFQAIDQSEITIHYIRLKKLEFNVNQRDQEEAYQRFIEEEALPFLEKTQDRLHLIEMYEELAAYYSRKFSYKNANHFYAKVNQLYKEYL
ncbi:helix-turn-helix domain-containing protein [Fictibacillus fluitans]|uniref:Helix-turn-helix domain-containing protein n=1 Tax=Fictibacillus fluitans TaxID=3058422 RepID=A0ABT8HVV2_9BACL|nr:helix-turn-helix domain-containing protein [Fictibacillus sp. NE201]MDN4524630.1 helix-turn-helix domain-containing protein [Fictibacillus sp. NE201]